MFALASAPGALRSRLAGLTAGALLALAAAGAAPSTELLPGPNGTGGTIIAALVLLAAFAAGIAAPLRAFYALVALVVIEGAIRKWIVNDVTVFLLKDFLLLGIYAAVLPRLRRAELRRPWWLVAPLAGIVILAVLHAPASDSLSQVLIGLRAYVIYVPLLWVAPVLLSSGRRVAGMCALIAGLAAFESLLAVTQALAGPGTLSKLVSGALPGLITLNGIAYLRPSGTFMQVGVLASFLFLAALVGFALVACFRRGALLWLGMALPALLAGGIVYTSARSLLGSVLLAAASLLVLLVARRRYLSAIAMPAAFALGLVIVLAVVPPLVDAVDSIVHPSRIEGAAQVQHVKGLDDQGRVVDVEVSTNGGGLRVGGGFLGRAADFNSAGGKVGLWSGRLEPQLDLIADQRLVGHGPGTMTLGAEYANPTTRFQGESVYSKLAWELGWPGLVLFLWLTAAFVVACFLGVLRAEDWQRPAALVGFAASVLLPLWYVLTFALDFPVVAVIFWAFAGCAVAYGSGAGPRRA